MGEIVTMKLKRQSENKRNNMKIRDEVGTNPVELEHFLENIGKRIGETREIIINEIHKIPETGNKPQIKTKPRRSLKKK